MLHSNNKQCIQWCTQININKQQSNGNYEQKWIDIGRVWNLSAQQFVPALHVCMFDIYVVIKKNHLDLHWTLSCVFKRITARTWTLKEQLNCYSTLMPCLMLLPEHILHHNMDIWSSYSRQGPCKDTRKHQEITEFWPTSSKSHIITHHLWTLLRVRGHFPGQKRKFGHIDSYINYKSCKFDITGINLRARAADLLPSDFDSQAADILENWDKFLQAADTPGGTSGMCTC